MGMTMNEKNEWGLTPQEVELAIEYFTTKNKTQAYMKVYDCTYEQALRKGWQKIKEEHMQKYIMHLFDSMENDAIMGAEETLVAISKIARGEDADLPKHQKIYAKDKNKALEYMAKHHMLLTEMQKVESEHRVVFVDDLTIAGDDSE